MDKGNGDAAVPESLGGQRLAEALRGPFDGVETANSMLGVPAASEGAATCSPIVVRVSHVAFLGQLHLR